jgi:hypothetical protein
MLQTSTNDVCPPDRVGQLLKDILRYLTEVVRLDGRRTNDQLPGDRRFVLHQNEFEGLPGITSDTRDEDGAVWLAVERLRDLNPPAPDADLGNWIDVSPDPEQRPRVRDSFVITVESAEKDRLIAAKHARMQDCARVVTAFDGAGGIWNVRLRLADHPNLAWRLERFVAEPWAAWADAERPRRKTMAIYQRLLDIVDLVENANPDRPVELVWGIGILRRQEVELPVLERLVEIEVMESLNGEIRIRPRLVGGGADPNVLASMSLTPARLADDAGSRILEAIEGNGEISPFVRNSFEPILDQIGLRLDRPVVDAPMREAPETEQRLLEISQKPVISIRWMIFARPRSNSLALRDIERLKDAIDRIPWKERALTGVVRILVLGPNDDGRGSGHRALPSVIGRPIDIGPAPGEGSANHSDPFFPLPFDDDQLEILRRLEKADGLAVQTASCNETIPAVANVICHYLARGQRVLVVSREAKLLSELRQRLPLATLDLAIGPTDSDKERSKQIATAIHRLQSIAETLRPHDQVALIGELERDVVTTRRRIGELDEEVANIARVHLRQLPGFVDLPFDIAKMLVVEPDPYSWFEDRPEELLAETGLSLAAVDAVRDARTRVENHLSHIDEGLPALAELPHPEAVARLHADLQKTTELSSTEARFAHRAVATMGVEDANDLAADLESLSAGFRLLNDEPWIAPFSRLGERAVPPVVDVSVIVDLARDASFQLSRRAAFLARPVEVPTDAFLNKQLVDAVDRLANRKPTSKLVALGKVKSAINAIKVSGVAPIGHDDWVHVRDYLMWRRDIHALNARWMSLAAELGATSVEAEFPQIILNLQRIETCVEAAVVAPVIARRNVTMAASSKLAMSRAEIETMLADGQRLHALAVAMKIAATELEALRRELGRLNKLFSGSGVLTASVRNEVLARIGKDQVAADQVRADWITVREQIGVLDTYRDDFTLISAVSEAIARAGAPRLARWVRVKPVNSTRGDQVLPTDWALAWNRAVLTRRLEAAGQRPRLRALGDQRQTLESRLHQLFEAVVAARTHLALAHTMTGPIKQALTDFVIASQKAGLTARDALGSRKVTPETLENCYQGIPCWMMPSWQLCEQLSSQQIGAFDLVIIQEASHCDVRDLTAMLRGRKVLVVSGEPMSSTAAGLENETLERLEKRFLGSVPKTIRPFLVPGSSLYDLTKVMFPDEIINFNEGVHRVEAMSRSAIRLCEANHVDHVPTTKEQSDLVINGSRMVDPTRKAEAKSPRLEADIIVSNIANTPTTASTAVESGAARLRSLEAALLAGGPELELGALRPSAGENISGAADIDVATSAKLEPTGSQGRHSSLIGVAEVQPKTHPAATERLERFGDRVMSGDKRGEPTPVLARSARPANATIRRVDTGVDIDASGRLGSHEAAHVRDDTARSRRSINRLAATLGAVSLIAALSMFTALVVAVYGLFGSNTNSEVGRPPLPSPPNTMSAPSKISDRIARSAPQAATGDRVDASGAEPVTLVAQPAMLYEEDPSDATGKQYSGTVTWQADSASPGPGLGTDVVVRADLEIPERRMSLTLSFRRNIDQTLSASHVFELRFNVPPDPPHGEISKVQGLAFKQAEKDRGSLLVAQTAKVTPGYFLVTLSPAQPDMQRNLKLLKEQSWFDIMFLYSNGNRAILAIEKGMPGERAFAQAFGVWGQ